MNLLPIDKELILFQITKCEQSYKEYKDYYADAVSTKWGSELQHQIFTTCDRLFLTWQENQNKLIDIIEKL